MDLPARLTEVVKYLTDSQQTRRSANLHHTRMYSNRLASSMSATSFSAGMGVGEARLRLNATKSAVDAALAQVATARPRPKRQTVGASRSQHKRAERLDRFGMGWFHKLQQYILALDVFMDAEIRGTGVEKFAAVNGSIHAERVLDDEILIDENEARVASPGSGPTFYVQVKNVPRNVLLARLPKFADKIKAAEDISGISTAYKPVDDPVTVMEAWHLPQRYDGKDGRHAIALTNVVLKDTPWKFSKPPFSFFRWNNAPLGFWGVGLVEEVEPLQLDLNYTTQKLQRAITLQTSVILKPTGSGLKRITNELGAIYEYAGQPPTALTLTPIPSEWFMHIDRLYQRIYELAGVSQMQAQASKPAGLYSGDAVRLFHDITSRRFAHTEQRWAQFAVDASEQIFDRAREIASAGGGNLRVLSAGDKEVEEIDWSEVATEQDKYVVQVHPTSIVPDTPSGKIEMMQTMAQIAPSMGPYLLRALSGIPDLEAAAARINAPFEAADRIVSNIVEYGIYEPPHRYMGDEALVALRTAAHQELLKAPTDELPEERQVQLRKIVDDVDFIQQGASLSALGGLPPPGGLGTPSPDAMQAMAGGAGGGQMPDMQSMLAGLNPAGGMPTA